MKLLAIHAGLKMALYLGDKLEAKASKIWDAIRKQENPEPNHPFYAACDREPREACKKAIDKAIELGNHVGFLWGGNYDDCSSGWPAEIEIERTWVVKVKRKTEAT